MRIRQRSLSLALFACVALGTAHAQRATISETPLSDRRVAYVIEAELNTEARTITGVQRLRWRTPDRKAHVHEGEWRAAPGVLGRGV